MPRFITPELIRFAALGVLNTVAGVLLLLLFVRGAGWPYIVAQVAVHLIVVTWAFFPSRAWVFQEPVPLVSGLAKFHLTYLSQLPISAGILALCMEFLETSLTVGQLIAMGCVAITNFVSQRFFVFRKDPDTSSAIH